MKRKKVIKSSLPTLNIIPNKSRWHRPLHLSYSFFYNFLFFLLFSFSFCQVIYGKKNPILDEYQISINNIKAVEDPSERAIQWVIQIYYLCNNYPHLIHQQIEVVDTLWPVTSPLKKIILLWTQSEIDKVKGNHSQAILNIEAAIALLENTPSKSKEENKLLCLAYSTFSKYAIYKKDKDGLAYAYKALDLAINNQYPTGEVFARNQIGLVIGYNQRNFKLALEYFMKAKELLPKLPPNALEVINGFIIANIAKTWSDLGDHEKSINYKLHLLKEEGENIKNIELLSGIYSNLGTNYYTLKKYDLAEKALKKTVELMETHQLLTNKGIPLLRLGFIKLDRGNLLGAAHYTDTIDQWLLTHQFVGNYEISFYQFKSKLAKANLDFEQAIFWLEKAAKEQAALHQMNNTNNLVKLETSNKFREIAQERVLLEKERELNQSTINLQKLLLLGTGFVTVLSIWFGIIFYEKNKEITEAYDYILSQSNEKKELTKSEQKIIEEQKVATFKGIDEALKQKIIHSLSINKSFLSPDLTLKKFADLVESNTSYVSQTINIGFEKNFNVLINEYRVEEVLRLFQEGQHQTFTIESIYQKAGFKSKSSFQKAFKAKTGVTASHYLNHIS